MSTYETDALPITWGRDTIFNWNDDVTYYYKEEVTKTKNDDGETIFDVVILRSDSADFSTSTEIGNRDLESGAINLYGGSEDDAINDIEAGKLNVLTQKLKPASDALLQTYVTYDDLDAEETNDLKITLGMANEADLEAQAYADDTGLSLEDARTILAGGSVESEFGGGEKEYGNDINVEIKGRNARTTYGKYYYPAALETSKQDRIKFTMKYSTGSRIETTTTAGIDVFQRREERITGSVTLPIQSDIKDQNSVKWNGASLNALQAFGAGAAMRIFNRAGGGDPIESLAAEADDIRRSAIGAFRGAAGSDNLTAINVYLAQQAVGTQRLLSRTAGAIVNPNVEMLFDAPSLRPFSFQFRMSPRSKKEAKEVRSIINFFKQGMSVKTSSSNVFLKAPNIFDIRYITYNNNGTEVDHPSINRIKTCALLAASVDYTPDNTYMTYDDSGRSMTSYGLTLSFNELDPIYEDDYLKSPAEGGLGMTNSTKTANEIGY